VIAFLVVTLLVGPFLQEEETSEDAAPTRSEQTSTTIKPTTTTARATTSTSARRRTTTTLSLRERAKRSKGAPLEVASVDFGDDWPLTVSGGFLSCRRVIQDSDLGAVVFGPSDPPYEDDAFAVNGTAKSRADDYGWREDLETIWADNPSIPGAKKNIGPLIDLGLSLCPD
jgi:hypothetical protein